MIIVVVKINFVPKHSLQSASLFESGNKTVVESEKNPKHIVLPL